MKINTIKTKKTNLIIFNDGYICIDSHYLIKADFVQLDDTLLQDKIYKNEPFAFNNMTRTFGENPPSLINIIPKDLSIMTELENTGLYTDILKTKAEIFYNPNSEMFCYFNADYLNIFKNTNLSLKLIQNDNRLSPAMVISENKECLFLVMPMAPNRENYLQRYEKIGL